MAGVAEGKAEPAPDCGSCALGVGRAQGTEQEVLGLLLWGRTELFEPDGTVGTIASVQKPSAGRLVAGSLSADEQRHCAWCFLLLLCS